jgi:hypothetical protein
MGVVFLKVPAFLVAVSLAGAPQQPSPQAPETAAPAQPATADTRVELPVSLTKIKKGLSRPPAIRAQETRPVFRVEVIAKRPTMIELLGPDYLIGPVPYGGMTHQEFLNMVTPTEYRGYSMFSNKEAITVAATSLALQWALLKAVDKLKDARTERAKEAARREVIEAMNQLEEARKKAGLPPK